MGVIDEYLSSVPDADRPVLERIYALAREVAPEAEEGTSYSMAALLYRGKGLVAAVSGKKFLSLYPYSGSVLVEVADALTEFEGTKGSVHFSADHPLPDDAVRRIVEARLAEIDAKPG